MFKSMTRFLLLGICITLSGAVAANASNLAGTLYDTTDGYTITINYTRAASIYSGIDLVDFTVASITDGTNNGVIQTIGGTVAQGNYGTFTASASATSSGTPVIYSDDGDPNDLRGTSAPGSFVNLNSSVGGGGATYSPTTALATYSSTVHGYTSMTDAWYTSTTARKLSAGSDLADIYVTTNADVTFVGAMGTSTESALYSGTFTTGVPEPSTLVLLVTGLFGMVAYAWRKRR